MMAAMLPLAATEKTAAQLLDMSVARFRKLVSQGCLPRPIKLADDVERWPTDQLQAIIRGDAAKPAENEDIEA